MIVPAVLLAGAAGAVLRYLVSRAFASRTGFPWAVLVVNIVGSAIGGTVLGLAQRGGLGDDLRLVLLTGLCGGFTTFSTWSVETIQLLLDGKVRVAVLSVSGNLVLGIGVAAVAYLLAA
ncbi:fluoride efflux transporter CrcB [soil metagenome]